MNLPVTRFLTCLLVAAAGCANKHFVDLGNGIGVPAESEGAYARDHGVTRDEARQAMLHEHSQRQPAQAVDASSMPSSPQ